MSSDSTSSKQSNEETNSLQLQKAGESSIVDLNSTQATKELSARREKVGVLMDIAREQPKTSFWLKIQIWGLSVGVIAIILLYSIYSNSVESSDANNLTAEVRKYIEEGDLIKAHVTLTKLSQVPERMSQSHLIIFVTLLVAAIATIACTRLNEQTQSHQLANVIASGIYETTQRTE